MANELDNGLYPKLTKKASVLLFQGANEHMKFPAILGSIILGSMLAGNAAAATMSSHAAELAQLQATAKSAQAAIAASPSEYKTMVSAIKMQSVSQSRAVLVRHGFTMQQLEGGVTVFSHQLLPKQVKSGQYYYFHLGYSPL
ncbi:MAG: hypothetical protein JOZ01_09230, partial [Candidatus Eremiobacteraeota bacterium]|nr:hypothetical protein [Candidatus Eremiobacteraeota bacterium]